MKKDTLIFLVAILNSCVLSGCQDKPHPPRVNEYGQTLVKNIHLNSSTTQTLNTTIPLPYNEASILAKYPKAIINFKGEPSKNPYRFVVVVKGQALNSGDVKLGFTTSTGLTYGGGATALGLITNDDNYYYNANEAVVAVLAGEPFSLSPQNIDKEYTVNAFIKRKENIKIDSVELQIWQGKSSKRSTSSYAIFGAVVAFFVYIATRLVRTRFSR